MTDATVSSEFLARMDEAILHEFDRSSRLRKLLPAEVEMPHARYGLVVPEIVSGDASSATTSSLKPPITLTREVRIASTQLEDLDLILELVRDATKRLCVAEDQVIAYGGELPKGSTVLEGVRVEGLDSATRGLMGPASNPSTGPSKPRPRFLLRTVADATVELSNGTPPTYAPYAAVLAPAAWAAYVPARDAVKSGIRAALQGECVGAINGPPLTVNKASPYVAVFSSDAIDLDLVRVRRPWGSLRGHDELGRLRFAIESQFLLRVKRPDAVKSTWILPEDDGKADTTKQESAAQ